ncbi:MAG: hypothetical protein K940chlam9_00752, partial [Chlamydiae bacterium]|nr:hypothetical protein [Chlamydiota bacterium]
ESIDEDEMRSFGFSKDQKSQCVQVVYCLVVNKEGLPLAYEAYRDNTAEVNTL